MRTALAMLALAACGPLRVVPEPILPPNVADACKRAADCGVFVSSQMPECIACLETVAEQWNAQLAEVRDPPKLSDVPCDVITALAHQTRLSSCVAGRWYGP